MAQGWEKNIGRRHGGHSSSTTAPRVPASEIIRLLRAGAIDEYRRVSPALNATCIYEELAQGLETVTGGREGEMNNDDDAAQRGWVSKEEFCFYFEAVTDLVDLNGLSLAKQIDRGCGRGLVAA